MLTEEDKQVIRDCFCETLRSPRKPFSALLGFDKAAWFIDELGNRIFDTGHFSIEILKELASGKVSKLSKMFTETEDFTGIGHYTKGGKITPCQITRSLDLSSPTDHEKHRLELSYKKKYHHWIRILSE